MPTLTASDPVIHAAATFVSERLAALGHPRVDPAAIVARTVAQNPRIPSLPLAVRRRWLCTEVAVIACDLACPHSPDAAAHALGLRPVLALACWGASERLMDDLDAAVAAAATAPGERFRRSPPFPKATAASPAPKHMTPPFEPTTTPAPAARPAHVAHATRSSSRSS